jgi:hypothetical protein
MIVDIVTAIGMTGLYGLIVGFGVYGLATQRRPQIGRERSQT